MRRRCTATLALVGLLAVGLLVAPEHADAQRRRSLRIAVIADGSDSPQYQSFFEALSTEVRGLFADRGRVTFPEEMRVGDWTQSGADALVATALADREVDLIVGLGLEVAVAVANTESLAKPVILPMAERGLTGLPHDGVRSGRPNLAYLGGTVDLERDIRRFHDIVRFERVAVVADARSIESAVAVESFIAATAEATGVEIQLVPAEPSAAQILEAIPEDAEAVLLSSMPRMARSEIPALVEGLLERRLPSFSFGGNWMVEQGILASVSSDDDYRRRARRATIFIERILSGERPESFSTTFVGEERMVINLATARAIGTYPRYGVVMEAELLHQEEAVRGEEFNLRGVMEMAAAQNLDLRVGEANVRASAYNIEDARSQWLPRVNLLSDYAWIDPDTASPIGQPEHLLNMRVRARQTLYNPETQGALETSKATQRSVEEGFEVSVQDTILEASIAYLDLLRAQTNTHIQRENLEVTRTNLSLAEVRVSVGTASRDEIYRWQIELANSRSAVIDALALASAARIRVNRVLNLPLETEFSTLETSPEDAEQVVTDNRFSTYLDNPWSFRILRDFFSQEAVARAPEMREINAAVESADANFRAQRNTWYAPRVWAAGGINGILYQGGVGGDGQSPIAGVPDRDRFVWDVGVNLAYPIFNGLQRRARVGQARADVEALEYARASVGQRVEERMRISMVALGATRPSIVLARDAATAASSNLEMVTDNYRSGTVDIIRLVDAQNQALVASLDAANAVYDFLQDYVRAIRASGTIDEHFSRDSRDEMFRRLADFAAQQAREEGVRPGSIPSPDDPGLAPGERAGLSGDADASPTE